MVLQLVSNTSQEGRFGIQGQLTTTGGIARIRSRARVIPLGEVSHLSETEDDGSEYSHDSQTSDVTQKQREKNIERLIADPAKIVQTLCIWNLDLHLVPDVWNLMARAVSPNIYAAIIQIRRICQKNRKVRFEVDVTQDRFQAFCSQVSAESRTRRFKWKVHIKDFSIGKKLSVEKANFSSNTANEPLLLCTYNINGFLKKRADLVTYLENNRVDIIGLQETRRRPDHWRLHLADFNTVEMTEDKEITGARGIAIAVRKGLNAFPVGRKTPHFLFLRVFGRGTAQPFIVGTVYLPHGRARNNGAVDINARRRVETELSAEIGRLTRQYPTDLVICMGDYNTVRKDLKRVSQANGMEIRRVQDGIGRTCSKGKSGKAIDHFLVTQRHTDLLTAVHVDRSLDGSDHWPLLGSIHVRKRINNDEPLIAKVVWKTSNIKTDKGLAIATHNFWDPLFVNEPDNEDPATKISRMGAGFADVCNKVGQATQLIGTRGKATKHVTTREHVKACLVRRRLYCALKLINRNTHPVQYAEAFWAYKVQRKTTATLAGKVQRVRWANSIVNATDKTTVSSRVKWHWMTSTAGWRRKDRSDTLNPICDSAGVLKLEGTEIREVWKTHFGKLASDPTGNSQNSAHWEEVLPGNLPPTIEKLNSDLTRAELVATLRQMKRCKAPGPDAIPMDFIRLFLTNQTAPKDADFDIDTGNPALNKLLLLLDEMWIHGCVPKSLNKAALVSIFKKGDPTDCGNYRGISLMDSTLKILISVLTSRLSLTVEEKNIICREQAGFRRQEECAAQGLALYETIRRRFNDHTPTYSLFLDFQKAYDMVPHEALFRKLDLSGVRGRFLNFLRGLYKDSIVVVKTCDGSCSEPFPLLRGLRQGCPMSPILFDVFINDIFADCTEHGVAIPVTTVINSRRTRGVLPTLLPGLLFADDGVLLAPSQEALKRSKDKVSRWADLHEMAFGIAKCGLLFFRDLSWNQEIKDEDALAFKVAEDWKINGELIPTVDRYTYLGLEMHQDLSDYKMAGDRLKKGRYALQQLEPFLRCTSITPAMKVTMVKSCVVSTMLYGSEIWGMKVRRILQMRKVILTAARWILGFRGPPSLSSTGGLLMELGLEDIAATVACRRTRAYLKFPSLKTWVAELLNNPYRLKQKNWLTITEMWLNRQVKAGVGASKNKNGYLQGFGESKTKSMRLVRDAVQLSTQTQWSKTAPGLIDYYASNYKSLYQNPAKFRDRDTWVPYFGSGLCILSLLRGNGYPTYRRLWRAKLVRESRCPFCRFPTSETRAHLLLRCPAWAEERERYIRRLINDARNIAVTDKAVVTLLLGGTTENKQRLNFYYPYEGAALDAGDRAAGEFSDGAHGDELPLWASRGCFQVAGFLEKIDKRRRRILKDSGALIGGAEDFMSVFGAIGQG